MSSKASILKIYYSGDIEDGKPHGEGEAEFPNGHSYFGDWLEGQRHGEGAMTYDDGSEYNGDWFEDKKHGQGTYTWSHGEQYTGEWLEGQQLFQSIFTSPDEDEYFNEIKDELPIHRDAHPCVEFRLEGGETWKPLSKESYYMDWELDKVR